MDIELRGKVDLLSENYKDIIKAFRWDGKRFNIVQSLLYGSTDRELDVARMKKIKKILKSKSKDKLYYTKNIINLTSFLIEDEHKIDSIYKNSCDVYELFISKGFLECEETIFASFILSKRYDDEKLYEKAERVINICNIMNGQDYIAYTILAIAKKPLSSIEKEYKNIRNNIIKTSRYNEQEMNLLSLCLVIEDKESDLKVEKALDIICNVNAELFKISLEAFPFITLASMIVEDAELFSKETKDVYNLINKKGIFKFFINKDTKMLISLCILLNKYIEEVKADLIHLNVNNGMNVLQALEEYIVFLCI